MNDQAECVSVNESRLFTGSRDALPKLVFGVWHPLVRAQTCVFVYCIKEWKGDELKSIYSIFYSLHRKANKNFE